MHPKQPFICDLCGKSFKNHSTIYAHIYQSHLNPTNCDICNSFFSSYVLYAKHVKRSNKHHNLADELNSRNN